MATTFSTYARLEPRPHERNLEAGFAAAIHDPAWFLARQWQMGEHQGENASSPVWVRYEIERESIHAADPRFDPAVIPAEAIVESELDDWWTMGRRVRIGRRVAGQVALPDNPSLSLNNPPPPYEHFHGRPDGLALWRARAELGIDPGVFGAEVPPEITPAWDNEHLIYNQSGEAAFRAGTHTLAVRRHRGGLLDWYSVDAAPLEGEPQPERAEREAIPAALQYPGAPTNRWWQLEDAEVDLGGYPPDSAHIPTALLTELIYSHSDDWFLFPVLERAGHVVSLAQLAVRDAFGREYSSAEMVDREHPRWPGLHAPQDWSLFEVSGLGLEPLVLWHVAELPLESGPLERVQFGLDEEANLLWGVERTVGGREVESRAIVLPEGPRFNAGQPSGDARKAREYAYVPAEGVVPFWHPYEIAEVDGRRRLVQRRLVDFSRQKPQPMPGPQAEVLQPKQIAPQAIPSNGIEVERRWHLARAMNGAPILWIGRRRKPLLAPPARRLRFDVMAEANLPARNP